MNFLGHSGEDSRLALPVIRLSAQFDSVPATTPCTWVSRSRASYSRRRHTQQEIDMEKMALLALLVVRLRHLVCVTGALLISNAVSAQNSWSQLKHHTDFSGVAFGQSIFVAVGSQNEEIVFPGVITTSGDGVTWAPPFVLDSPYQPKAVAYGNGKFVVVGSFGSWILVSSNGYNWTWSSTPSSSQLNGVCYGNGLFVAVGDSGTILTSPDGLSWTARPGGSSTLYAATYGNGIFVAVGAAGTILTSNTGTTWSFRASNTTKNLGGVAYGDTKFVAVANSCGIFSCSGAIIKSSDGISWSAASSTPSLSSIGLNCVTFGNGRFVAAGQIYDPFGDNTKIALGSLDGDSWTQVFSSTPDSIKAVTYGNGTFVAVGTTGTTLISSDGVSFTVANSGYSHELIGAAYGNSTFVLVGAQGTILTLQATPQGVNWRKRTSGTTSWLNGAAYGNGLFVAVGDSGTIRTSPSGESWTGRSSGTNSILRSVAYGSGKFVAVGDAVVASQGGVTWQRVPIPGLGGLSGVTYGNGRFVAVGQPGVLASPDGVNWTAQMGPVGATLRAVAYGRSTFVAVGDAGTILTTQDFVTWRTNTLNVFGIDYLSIAFGQGFFVIAGKDRMLYSSDAVTWVNTFAPPTYMQGVAYGHNAFVAVGGVWSHLDGIILLARTAVSYPAFSIRRNGQNAVLSWTAWANDFQPEATDALGPQATWSVVTDPIIQTSEISFAATNLISGDRKFYRLRQL